MGNMFGLFRHGPTSHEQLQVTHAIAGAWSFYLTAAYAAKTVIFCRTAASQRPFFAPAASAGSVFASAIPAINWGVKYFWLPACTGMVKGG
jgi:hypothetical protein